MLNKPLDGAVAVRFFMPSAALAPYVSTYYLTEINLAPEDAVEDWLHPEWANLRFATGGEWSAGLGDAPREPMSGAILTGPTSQARTSAWAGEPASGGSGCCHWAGCG